MTLTDEPVLTFADGLVGFEGPQRFQLRAGGNGSPFSLLASIDDDLAFVVAPATMVADYEPDIEEVVDALGMVSSAEAEVLVIVTVAASATTLNLLGPLVVNRSTMAGRQAVLDPERWPSRHPIVASA
jgi:flagellar assembly factor FliW